MTVIVAAAVHPKPPLLELPAHTVAHHKNVPPAVLVVCKVEEPHVEDVFTPCQPASSNSQSLQRIHWLTVHSGPRMTVAALCQGGVRADGCHSTFDGERGLVITYIHLAARCRRTQISRFIEQAFGSAGLTRVVEAVCDKSLIETPEFQLLVRHFVEHDNGLVCDGGGMGLLSRFNRPCRKQVNSSSSSTKKQSVAAPQFLELENAELRQRIASLERDRLGMEDRLRAAYTEKLKAETEMGSMRQALFKANHSLCGYESELKRLRIENSEFRRLGVREKEARRLNRELITLQSSLEDKTKDCRMLEMMLCIAREDNDKLERIAAMAPRPRSVTMMIEEK